MNVVNYESGTPWHSRAVELRERIVAAYEHGKENGRFETQHEWADRAGLSKNYVTSKLAVLNERPTAGLSGKHGHALATVAGVSARWLITGEGSMLAIGDGHDRRAVARAFWLERDEQQEDLPNVLLFLREFENRSFAEMSGVSVDRWLATYGDEFRKWRRLQKSGGAPVGSTPITADDGDEGPPIRRKR